MDLIEFSNMLPSNQLVTIFKKYFEQHMAAFGMLNGIQFGGINVTEDKSSIVYCVRLLNEEDKLKMVNHLSSSELSLYGNMYKPNVYMNGDLLCISFKI